MELEIYRMYLKKTGRKKEVIVKYIRLMEDYEQFLEEKKGKKMVDALPGDLEDYCFGKEQHKTLKTNIYAIMLYYKAIKNEAMLTKAAELRKKKKSKLKPMALKDIIGIDPTAIKSLRNSGITDVNKLLAAGKTKKQRKKVAEEHGIPYETVLELVKIADLTRIGYVKSKLTRLFYNAGIESPEMMAKWRAEDLREHFEKYIADSGWDGKVPNQADLKNNITSAKRLPREIEYAEDE